MSDRLKYPVECAGCGVATHEPSIGRYAEPFCHECKDKENTNPHNAEVATLQDFFSAPHECHTCRELKIIYCAGCSGGTVKHQCKECYDKETNQ